MVSSSCVRIPESHSGNRGWSPLQLAIMFNAKHLNWSTNDYMEAYLEGKIQGYEQLRDVSLKAAIQLIKGEGFQGGNSEDLQ